MKKRANAAEQEMLSLEPMLTIAQAADILAVSQATLFRLIKHEGLPVTKMGHSTRISRRELHTWITKHTA